MLGDLLFYCALYIAIGLLIALIIGIFVYFMEIRRSPKGAEFEDRDWQEVLVNVAKVFGFSLLWPGILGSGLKMLFDKYCFVKWRQLRQEREKDRRWAPSLKDLQRRVTVHDAEQLNVVFDPMGAAPNAPFGHFAKRWLEFRGDLPPEAPVWWFDTIGCDQWGREHIARGYAVRKWWRLDRVFVSEFRPVEYHR